MTDRVLSPFHRSALCGMAIGMFMLSYGDRAVLSVSMPLIAHEFNLGPAQTGWVLSSFLWSYVILTFPASLLVDRYPTRTMGVAALLIWSVAMFMGGLSATLFVFLMSRVLLGIGETPTFPLANRIVRQWSGEQHRGMILTALVCSSQIGLAFGLLGSGWLAGWTGWRSAFLAYGALSIVMAVCWRSVFPAEAVKRMKWSDGRSLLNLLTQRTFWGLLSPGAAGQYANFLMMSWFPTYLHRTFHLQTFETGLDASICYGVAAVFSVVLGKVAEKISLAFLPKQILAPRRLVVAVLLLGSSVIGILPFLDSVWLVLFCVSVVIGLIMAALGANTALGSDLLVDGTRIGSVTGFGMIFGNGVGFLAPVTTGYLVHLTGTFSSAFYLAAFVLVAGAALATLLPRQPLQLTK